MQGRQLAPTTVRPQSARQPASATTPPAEAAAAPATARASAPTYAAPSSQSYERPKTAGKSAYGAAARPTSAGYGGRPGPALPRPQDLGSAFARDQKTVAGLSQRVATLGASSSDSDGPSGMDAGSRLFASAAAKASGGVDYSSDDDFDDE